MKKSKPECVRWTPVRRGAVYCSPGCGANCTHAAFKKAHADAKALVKRLGPGWKADVWENLGWHYAAVSSNNYVKVHPYKRVKGMGYTVFFGCPGYCGGDFTTQEPNLRKALLDGLRIARAKAEAANNLVTELEQVV